MSTLDALISKLESKLGKQPSVSPFDSLKNKYNSAVQENHSTFDERNFKARREIVAQSPVFKASKLDLPSDEKIDSLVVAMSEYLETNLKESGLRILALYVPIAYWIESLM